METLASACFAVGFVMTGACWFSLDPTPSEEKRKSFGHRFCLIMMFLGLTLTVSSLILKP